jgi:YVTN family beta-propeller protein
VTRNGRPLALGSPKQRALLGFLVLHANELVSRDRLIDEVWGDAAPATVGSALNVYLSRLRRLLEDGTGEEVLATRSPGYVLQIPADSLDARVFEDLVEEARRALAAGATEKAASTLRSALSLWRGPALADLAFEQFAQGEIGRLEELRVAALEDRIEVDLALGRHETVVAELEALVREQPYRERLRAQLMLALYRSGRQAESLDAYRAARRDLVESLGIEPGPRLQELERAILRQDPTLELPGSARTSLAAPGRRGRLVPALTAGALLIGAAATALALRDEPAAVARSVTLQGNSIAVIDPAARTIAAEIPVGGRPSGIAVGEGFVWVGNSDDDTLLQLDPESRAVVNVIGLGAQPSDVDVGEGSVWVLSTAAERLLRVDPSSGDVVASIPVPVRDAGGVQIEVGGGAAWVVRCIGGFMAGLIRIDADTHAVTTDRRRHLTAVAYGEEAFWGLEGVNADWIVRIDPRTSAVIERTRLSGVGWGGRLAGIAVGGGALWSSSHQGETLWKIDPLNGRLAAGVPLGRRARGVVADEHSIWVLGSDATVLRIDPERARVVETIRLGVYPPDGAGLGAGEGSVWVPTLSP